MILCEKMFARCFVSRTGGMKIDCRQTISLLYLFQTYNDIFSDVASYDKIACR